MREDPYFFSDATGGMGRILHDAALKAKPEVHRRLLLKPYFRESEYCLSCHKVSLSEPINEYRWLRAQDEYDDWDDSGVSLNASRTFYLPTTRRVCQDCHMPPVPAPLGDLAADSGTVRSHSFTAANTALPFLRGDTASLRRIEDFLRDEKVSVDIFAVRRGDGTTLMDPGDGGVPVRPGDRVRVDVVIRNRGVGHTFPGGTNDSNESWLEVSVLGAGGTLLARSGGLDEDGSLDSLAHVFKSVLLDSEGEPIHDRNGARIHVTAASNVIGPGASDIAQYAFDVPETLDGEHLTVRARLLYRKFDSRYAAFAFNRNPDGFVGHESLPKLPIAEMSVDQLTLGVTGAPGSPTVGGSPWQSYNDYGIALLLQGNTLEARAAFEAVARDSIGAFEGHLNLSRAALRDGNLVSAFQHLDRAEALRAGDPRAAWVWANAHQEDGSYNEAADAYRYVLRFFPGDRAAWRGLGRALYLAGRYPEALEAFASTLAIDPEDRVSHYHTMLSLRALGREEEASLAQAAYERYRVDESAQAISGAFLQRNAGVNLMAQPIHTHALVLSGR
jgi:tetratricopeptide (TPR) repeat protein